MQRVEHNLSKRDPLINIKEMSMDLTAGEHLLLVFINIVSSTNFYYSSS